MQNIRVTETDIGAYVSHSSMYGNVFLNPIDSQTYRTNPALSGRLVKDDPAPAQTIAFYEATPDGGTRAFACTDGQVHRVTESEWQRIKAIQHLAH